MSGSSLSNISNPHLSVNLRNNFSNHVTFQDLNTVNRQWLKTKRYQKGSFVYYNELNVNFCKILGYSVYACVGCIITFHYIKFYICTVYFFT